MKNKIVILILLSTILFALFFVFQNTTEKTQEKTIPESDKSRNSQTTLILKPEILSLSSTDTQATQSAFNVQINTKKNKVTAVQLELSFDPTIIKNVSVVPGSFFEDRMEFLNTVDHSQGRISYALGIPPSVKGKKGKGIVATIVFSVQTSNQTTSSIRFLPKTLVSAEKSTKSVLKSTKDATLNINIPSPNQ